MSNCLRSWNGTKERLPRCWQPYRKYFTEQAKLNQSTIISEETLSWLARKIPLVGSQENFLQRLFWPLSLKYNILILIAYRDYHDWIHSYYNQIYKYVILKDSLWPEDGGNVIPSIEKYLDTSVVKEVYSYQVLNFFSKGPYQFKILDMNSDNDIMKEFFCYGLPFNLCNMSKHVYTKKENIAADYLLCDMLGTEAYKRGFINKNISRYDVFAKVLEYQKSRGLSCNDFAKACPNETFYSDLFQHSFMLRNKILLRDSSISQHNEEYNYHDYLTEKQYYERFESVRHKFCTINTTHVLLQKEWKTFFTNLA